MKLTDWTVKLGISPLISPGRARPMAACARGDRLKIARPGQFPPETTSKPISYSPHA